MSMPYQAVGNLEPHVAAGELSGKLGKSEAEWRTRHENNYLCFNTTLLVLMKRRVWKLGRDAMH